MNIQQLFRKELISEKNINSLVDHVFSLYNMTKNSRNKCIAFFKKKFTEYLLIPDNYPENEMQFSDAIAYLNHKCINDFQSYLAQKFPNMKINSTSTETSSIKEDDDMIIITEAEKNMLLKNDDRPDDNNESEVLLYMLSQKTFIREFIQMLNKSDFKSTFDAIITEDEKNNLVSTYGLKQNIPSNKESLIEISNRVKEIKELENKHKNDARVLQELHEEKKKIAEIVKKTSEEYQKDNTTVMVNYTNQDQKTIIDINMPPGSIDLDHEFIEIENKSTKTILSINLTSYHIANSVYTIDQFNNNFVALGDNEYYHEFNVPPGNYDSQKLVEVLSDEFKELNFSLIGDILQIRSPDQITLFLSPATIMYVLGFENNQNRLEDKAIFQASRPIKLDARQTMKMMIQGCNPVPLKYNVETKPDQHLKYLSASGFQQDTFGFKIVDELDQKINFNEEIKLSITVTYII